MGPTEFIAAAGQGQLGPVYFLHGPDRFLHEECRAAVISSLAPEVRAWCLSDIEFKPEGLERELEAARQMPMLGGHSFFLFSDPEDFKHSSDEDYEALDSYLANPSSFSTVVFSAAEPDRRRRFIQLLEKKAVVVELRALARREAAAWLQRYLSARGVTIDPKLADELAARFERHADSRGDAAPSAVNLLGLRTEVEKLLTARFGAARLERGDLELVAAVQEEHEIGRLLEALAERKCGAALERLRSLLASKEPETLILWSIGDLFRQALKGSAGPAYGAVRGGWSGSPLSTFEIARRAARAYSREELMLALRSVRAADLAVKSSWKDARILLEVLVWQIVLALGHDKTPAFELSASLAET